MVILLGLAAAALYGTGDFLGGLAARRAHVLAVLTLAETAGVIVALPAAAPVARPGPPGRPGLGNQRRPDRRAWPDHLLHRPGGRADERGRAGIRAGIHGPAGRGRAGRRRAARRRRLRGRAALPGRDRAGQLGQ